MIVGRAIRKVYSNHANTTIAGAQTNHLERAKRMLGPNMPVLSGNGRWCLRTPMGAYLFSTREEAERSTPDLSNKYIRIFDIGTDEADTAMLDKIRDVYDPEEARRERRAKRAAQAQGSQASAGN